MACFNEIKFRNLALLLMFRVCGKFCDQSFNGSQHSQVSLACLAVLDKAVFYRHIYLHYILMVL